MGVVRRYRVEYSESCGCVGYGTACGKRVMPYVLVVELFIRFARVTKKHGNREAEQISAHIN
jgi:hypothetical protein